MPDVAALPPGFVLDAPQGGPGGGGALPPGFKLDAPGPDQPLSWGDVGQQAWRNAPSSAAHFAKDVVQPFLHPIDTANAVKNVGEGLLEKAGVMSGTAEEAYPDAVGQYFAKRYGGMENFKKSLATDPVGVAADLSTLLTAGGGALARAPGVIGKVGEIAATVGDVANPLSGVAKAAGAIGGKIGLGEKAATIAAPTTDELRAAADEAYSHPSIKALAVKPNAVQNWRDETAGSLDEDGFTAELAPRTHGVLKHIDRLAGQGPITGTKLDTVRKMLNRAASVPDATEQAAATRVKGSLDSFIETLGQPKPPPTGSVRYYHGHKGQDPTTYAAWLTPYEEYARNWNAGPNGNDVHYVDVPKDDAIQAGGYDDINNVPQNFQASLAMSKGLKPKASPVLRGDPQEVSRVLADARGNYAAAKRAETVENKVDRAELNASSANSGQNLDNATRQQIKSILASPKLSRGYSADELAQMRKVVTGTFTGDAARHVSNMLGKGGGLGATFAGVEGARAGMMLGGPVGALAGAAGPAVGYAFSKVSNAITKGEVDKLQTLIRSRSPLARQIVSPLKKFGEADTAYRGSPSPKTFSRLLLASRNLATNLGDAGITVQPEMLLGSGGQQNASSAPAGVYPIQ